MPESGVAPAKLKPALLACLVMLVAAGCTSVNLGDIDENPGERDDMSGPGIFADENGETTLKWSTDSKPSNEKTAQTSTEIVDDKAVNGIEPEQPAATTIQPAQALDEKAEFEEFKKWNRMRTEGTDSAEYQDFLLWLKYQKLKN